MTVLELSFNIFIMIFQHLIHQRTDSRLRHIWTMRGSNLLKVSRLKLLNSLVFTQIQAGTREREKLFLIKTSSDKACQVMPAQFTVELMLFLQGTLLEQNQVVSFRRSFLGLILELRLKQSFKRESRCIYLGILSNNFSRERLRNASWSLAKGQTS